MKKLLALVMISNSLISLPPRGDRENPRKKDDEVIIDEETMRYSKYARFTDLVEMEMAVEEFFLLEALNNAHACLDFEFEVMANGTLS